MLLQILGCMVVVSGVFATALGMLIVFHVD